MNIFLHLRNQFLLRPFFGEFIDDLTINLHTLILVCPQQIRLYLRYRRTLDFIDSRLPVLFLGLTGFGMSIDLQR